MVFDQCHVVHGFGRMVRIQGDERIGADGYAVRDGELQPVLHGCRRHAERFNDGDRDACKHACGSAVQPDASDDAALGQRFE